MFFLIFFLFGSSDSTYSVICSGAGGFWAGFCGGAGLVDVLVVALGGVLEGVLRAGLFLVVGLSIVSLGSGKMGAGSKLLVQRRYSEVLRGTMGVVVVFL